MQTLPKADHRELLGDLAELQVLLARANRESRGTVDDRFAQSLIRQLLRRRCRQLRQFRS